MSEEQDKPQPTDVGIIPLPRNSLAVDFMGLGVNKDDVVSIGIAKLEELFRAKEREARVEFSKLEDLAKADSQALWNAIKKYAKASLEAKLEGLGKSADAIGLAIAFEIGDISLEEVSEEKTKVKVAVNMSYTSKRGNEKFATTAIVLNTTAEIRGLQKAVERSQKAVEEKAQEITDIQRKIARMSIYERRLRSEVAAQHLQNTEVGQDLLTRITSAAEKIAKTE